MPRHQDREGRLGGELAASSATALRHRNRSSNSASDNPPATPAPKSVRTWCSRPDDRAFAIADPQKSPMILYPYHPGSWRSHTRFFSKRRKGSGRLCLIESGPACRARSLATRCRRLVRCRPRCSRWDDETTSQTERSVPPQLVYFCSKLTKGWLAGSSADDCATRLSARLCGWWVAHIPTKKSQPSPLGRPPRSLKIC